MEGEEKCERKEGDKERRGVGLRIEAFSALAWYFKRTSTIWRLSVISPSGSILGGCVVQLLPWAMENLAAVNTSASLTELRHGQLSLAKGTWLRYQKCLRQTIPCISQFYFLLTLSVLQSCQQKFPAWILLPTATKFYSHLQTRVPFGKFRLLMGGYEVPMRPNT
jgi:hypothetical protein